MRTRTVLLIGAGFVTFALIVFLIKRTSRPVGEDGPAVQALLDIGGKVTRDESASGRPVTEIHLSRARIADDDLRLLEPFPGLIAVHLVATNVTGEGLTHLRHLRSLRTLDLRGSPVTDAGLAALTQFPDLEVLVLRATRVTDAGLPWLAGVPNLRELNLAETAVTDAGIRHLKPLKHLEVLELPAESETEAGFHELHALGLTHLFAGMRTAGNRRPHRPEDAVFAAVGRHAHPADVAGADEKPHRLCGFPITPAVVRELLELPNLRHIFVPTEELTDEVLLLLGDTRRLHFLGQAAEPGPSPGPVLLGHPGMADRDDAIKQFDLTDAPISDGGLAALARLPALERLNVSGTKITAKGVAAAARWPRLRELTVRGLVLSPRDVGVVWARPNLVVHGLRVEHSDEALKELRAMRMLGSLVELQIRRPDVEMSRDAGLLQQRRTLSLRGPRITDVGLRELAGYEDFAAVELIDTRVTGAGLAALKDNPGLVDVSLVGSPVTDDGLRYLAGLSRLTALNLQGTAVTDAGLAGLKPLTTLRWLDLSQTRVTDAGLDRLGGMASLKYLGLEETAVTPEGIRKLRVALPGCRIAAGALTTAIRPAR